MQDKKFIFGIIFATIGLLVGAVVLASKMEEPSVQANQNASVSVNEISYDWGEIGLNDGNVEKEFEIKNDGSEKLILTNVTTSCMCTTAQLSLGDQVSPVFGMHTKSDYKLEIPSGEVATLNVIFDPAFHGPSGVGPINRQIQVATNDSENQVLNFILTAVVRS